MHRNERFYLLLLALTSAHSVFAQTAPNAGSLLQQIERSQELHQNFGNKRATELLAAPPPEMVPSSNISVSVKEFRFAGNSQIRSETLAAALASYLNRPLDFNGLNQAAAVVAEVYRQAGWIVRVYLPRQEISEGVVTLQIIEGVLGKVLPQGEALTRFSSQEATGWIDATQPTGALLSAERLDRALLLLDDLPGVTASGSLAPGASHAESDLLLKLADEPLAVGELGADTTGSRSTGPERATFNGWLNSPLKIGDQISTNLIHAQGTDYGRLGYTIPIGKDGLRVGASMSSMAYQLITPEYNGKNAKGTSDTAGLEASYPLIRSKQKNLNLTFNADQKAFNNESGGAVISKYQIQSYSIGVNGNFFDEFGGGGANSGSLILTNGNLDLSDNPKTRKDWTGGDFTKLRFSLSRQQAITKELSLYAGFNGQISNKNLDSAEKLYLGGAYGVRAYPTSEGGGTEGQIVTLELRQRIQEKWLLVGFYDYGDVRQYKNNSDTGGASLSGTSPNRYALQGYGVSLGWTGEGGLSLKATWAHRHDDNPNPNVTSGNDQDGSHTIDRLWLTAAMAF